MIEQYARNASRMDGCIPASLLPLNSPRVPATEALFVVVSAFILGTNTLRILSSPASTGLSALGDEPASTPAWMQLIYMAIYAYALVLIISKGRAGKPGHAPFPAVLSSSARPDILRDRICREGIEVIAASEFETSHIRLLRRKSTVLYYSVRMISAAMQLVSAGRYGSLTSDFYLIARRPRAESTLAETG